MALFLLEIVDLNSLVLSHIETTVDSIRAVLHFSLILELINVLHWYILEFIRNHKLVSDVSETSWQFQPVEMLFHSIRLVESKESFPPFQLF